MKFLILSFLVFFTFNISFSQEWTKVEDLHWKFKNKYDEAIKEGRKNNFKKSIKNFQKVIDKYPNFIDAKLKLAGMYYNAKEFDKSVAIFKEVIEMAPHYDPLIYYSLAIVYNDTKDYENAAKYFDEFVRLFPEEPLVERATNFRNVARFRDKALKNPVPFTPVKLKGGVNTKYSEYMPAMNIEGDKMIFTRRVGGQEDFYIAKFEEDEFVEVTAIDALNTPQNEGVHTVSADGKTLIFTACDRRKTGLGSCDLYYTRLDKDNWHIPRNMGKVINTIWWDAQPSLSADGHKLYFSSNRKYGHGGNDIWVSTRTDTSGWTPPIPLPTEVNSEGNDESPFIHPDGHTLYFRSNGRPGMGDYDIYYSRYIDSTDTWTEAKNIGHPINTEGSEGALAVSLDGKTAYFASDMAYLEGNERPNLDIYSFPLYEDARPWPTTFVKAKIVDADSGLPLEAGFSIESLEKEMADNKGVSDEDGTFIISLPTNLSYALFIEKEGYALHSENFKVRGINSSNDPYVLQVALQKISSDPKESDPKPIVLNNIFFASGSSELLATSDREISRLANNLKDNPTLKIEIHGHTDNVGSEEDNLILSTERAKAVENALIEKGISKNRISSNGFGETSPIASNDTEEGRQKNRRTEFIIK